MTKTILLFFLATWSIAIGLAQNNSISEKSVLAEELFLQAMQEKILGNTEKAITLFERIIKEEEDNDAAYYQLSKIFNSLDKKEEALKNIQKASTLDPSNKYYQMTLADYYEEQEMYLDAADAYRQLYESGNQNTQIIARWVDACVKAKAYDQALDILDILQKDRGLTMSIANKQYDILMAQDKPKKAEKIVKSLLKSHPDQIEVLYLMAMHYKQTRNESKAENYFAKILEIDPDNSKANIALAESFKNEGQDKQYLSSIQSVIENPNIAVDLKIKEVIPYLEKLKSDPSSDLAASLIDIVQDLSRIHPDEAKVRALSGDVYYHSGERERAIESYAKAVELQPEIWSVWEHLFYLQAESNKLADLIKWTNKAKDFYLNQALVYYMSAIGQAKLGNYSEALSELDEASFMVGKNMALKIDILALRGTIHQKLGEHDAAIKWLNDALKLNPDHLPAINALAQSMLSSNMDQQEISTLIERGLNLDENYLPLMASKGRLYFKSGQYNKAKDWLEKILDQQGNTDTSMIELLGDTYFQLGEVDQAIELWNKAIQLNSPNSPILQQKIETKSLIK